jgi:hypothetical protein
MCLAIVAEVVLLKDEGLLPQSRGHPASAHIVIKRGEKSHGSRDLRYLLYNIVFACLLACSHSPKGGLA